MSPLRPRRRGDRYDGRLLRTLDPFYRIIPYIMRTRVDAHDYFEDRIDIAPAEAWLRGQRASGHPELGYLHLFVTALVRTMSQHPRLNRFVAGRRIYARGEILISLAVKPRLSHDSPETVVKMRFEPAATVYQVAATVDAAVAAIDSEAARTEADRTARILMRLPGWLLRLAMALFRWLDFHGWLPRAVHRASPFHTSAFVTDLGSLGIKPIYHHLYDFGTTSIFLAFGMKERETALDEAGRPVVRKWISLKAVNDERICDGHAYASAFKYMLGLFRHPERLERPPPALVEDVD
jgi:hypothetical protein